MLEAVERYNALLERSGLAAESVQVLREGQRQHGLTFGDRPLSISLRPHLLSRERYQRVVQASEALYGALQRLEQALLADSSLRGELSLQPEEERLALADPGCRSSSSSSRLDGFFAEGFSYLEYNAESPAGMAYNDELTAVFNDLPVMRAFRRQYRLRALTVRRHQLAAMLRAFRQWGGAETPVIGIVDWSGLPTSSEFEMFRDYFESKSIRTLICDPRDLEFRHGRLLAPGGHAINFVYRRVLTSELLARGSDAKALVDAYLAGAVCVVNTFRAKLLHKKMSLALLSDDRYEHLYTTAQRRAIAAHIPWTRKLEDRATSRNGRRVDLVEHVLGRREKLVLKPNDEYGGKGVVLGWEVDAATWARAVKTGLAESYVVQEAVPVPREAFPVAEDSVRLLDLAVDTDPYLFDGRVMGCLARLSSSDLLNVTAGSGSVVPTYILEGAR